MEFEEAVDIVTRISKGVQLSFEEYMSINKACAILALEYIKVRDRIAPA